MSEQANIYKDYNAGELNLNGEEMEKAVEEEIKELNDENGIYGNTEESSHEEACNPDEFCIKSREGVSINGVIFSRGTYTIGQLVGNLTIDKDIKNNLLCIDSQAIKSNPHSA